MKIHVLVRLIFLFLLLKNVQMMLLSVGINSTLNPLKQTGVGALASTTSNVISRKDVFPQSSETENLAVCVPNGYLALIAPVPVKSAEPNELANALIAQLIVTSSVHSSTTRTEIST